MLLLHTNLAFNAFHYRGTQPDRSHQQFAIGMLPRVAREQVEQIGNVRANIGSTGEEAKVFIDPCRRRVIVSGAKMDIAAQPSASLRTTIATLACVLSPTRP